MPDSKEKKEPHLSSLPKHKNAYAWLFMKGDFYLPGVLVSAYSIARTNPDADLVVMITDDVSLHSQNMLLKVATHLFHIPYISFESKQMKTERQRQLYGTWIASSYTKWNALALPYEKILLIDGDTIHTENTDELFDLPAPAMPLASPFVEPLGKIHTYYDGPVGLDGYPVHGAPLDLSIIDNILNKGGVLPTSTPALIAPSVADYKEYITMIKSMEPFGFPECHSGFDEQSISYFYLTKKRPYTTIHQKYNYYPWKDGFIFPGDVPRIIHFFSDTKPWTVDFDKYPDVITWYKMAVRAIEDLNITAEDIALKTSNTSSAKSAEDLFSRKFLKTDDVLQIYGTLKIPN